MEYVHTKGINLNKYVGFVLAPPHSLPAFILPENKSLSWSVKWITVKGSAVHCKVNQEVWTLEQQ